MQREVIARGVLAEAPFGPLLPALSQSNGQVFLSDLHLNSEGGQDNCQQALLRPYLASLRPGAVVTVAGDGFDLLEEPSYWRIQANCGATLSALNARRAFFISGNHDPNLAAWPLRQAYFPEELDLSRAFVWHGHQLDPACSGGATMAMRVAAFAWGVLERLGLGPRLHSWKDGVEEWYRRRRGRRARTASKAGENNAHWIADAIRRDKVLYISGHTHLPELVNLGGGHWYANPGSWVETGVGYAIEVEGVDISLVRITG
jgi:UDP-2,3-diacylglucosamine pyrophosphatase LpxH